MFFISSEHRTVITLRLRLSSSHNFIPNISSQFRPSLYQNNNSYTYFGKLISINLLLKKLTSVLAKRSFDGPVLCQLEIGDDRHMAYI